MLHYSELHPQWVDTQSSQRAVSHKRGRGEGAGDVGEMKKVKVSSDDTGLDESQSEQIAERRPPVVLFTGISQSAVKKLKTVSMCVGIWILAALNISWILTCILLRILTCLLLRILACILLATFPYKGCSTKV